MLSSLLEALDIDYFTGINLKKTQAKISHNLDIYIPTQFGTIVQNEQKDQSIQDTSPELKIGVILNNQFRVYLSAIEYKTELFKLKLVTGNYEYLIPINDNFRFFTGFHLGTFKDNMVYGLQIGSIYDITKNIEFEIGGVYSKYRKDVKIEGEKFGYSYSNRIKVKNSSSIYTGFNFKF
ncbi:hypothetical protein CRU91_02480 [Aliarcobacter vitoriensis]|uniref:Outer membrane protein beta-barrel domain-containing protein n=2 Tax=Aliarcobacter vitoriensis TaxID=2011099 RepID=A0A366MUT2_9BACT|nr:hypothetical protein CRU91_02480 [Aliarcobacter vitoriensis]